ncbi:MAG: septum formation initiator family protein [Clostridia bacterium]
MARSRYEYSTSPRKLQPDYRPKKQTKKRNLKVVEDLPRQDVKVSKVQRERQMKLTLIVVAVFILLLTISYRNSQINEKFSEVQSLKNELSSLQKENEQLKVSIENGLNLNNIEKLAKEKLGMQKLTNKQTLYVSLPKRDYVESATEEVVIENSKNWFEQFVDKIFHK